MSLVSPSRLVLVTSLAALACFDVNKVPLPPFMVDDFEDGDLDPPSEKFERWTCGLTSDPSADGGVVDPDAGGPDGGPANVGCSVGPVGNHDYAMTLQFALQDPPDGEREFGGVELATRSTGLDLSGFKQLVLSAILEQGNPSLPPGTQLRIEIGCRGLNGPRILEQVVPGVVVDSDWATFTLDLARFAAMDPACLREPDMIRVAVRPGLLDGQDTRGSLHVDNIYLQ